MPEPLLNADGVRRALNALGEDLASQGVVEAKICVVGGVAVLFQTYDRALTIDIDALLEPESEILESAARVAAKLGLPEDWLNSAAKQFLPSPYSGRGQEWQRLASDQFQYNLYFASVEMLLAMKTLSFIKRPTRDSLDLLNLAVQSGRTTLESIIQNFEEFYPDDDIPDPVRTRISALLQKVSLSQVRGQLPL